MAHKAGFVNIIGNPNVGKSTLMNALIGEKLSIITSKAQTTRHRILGIVNGEDFQIVYSDTPGIINPGYKLQEVMLKYSKSALNDADIILYITDIKDNADKNQEFIARLNKGKAPVLLLINKIDLSDETTVKNLINIWQQLLPDAEVIPISATERFNVDLVFERILSLLPESPPFYPKDTLTDKSERFFVSEIIREKILLNYQKEIPYSVEVEVETFKDKPDLIQIRSIIYVAKESQKGIIIGHRGQALKKTGTMARKDIEKVFRKKIFLELHVKVKKDWRNNSRLLKQFGYQPD